MENIDKRTEELLGQLGKTKEDLVRELEELNEWMETTKYNHGLNGIKEFVSLGYLFYKRKVFEYRVEDVKNRAKDWDYEISNEEAEEVVILLQEIYDCNLSENDQIESCIKTVMQKGN